MATKLGDNAMQWSLEAWAPRRYAKQTDEALSGHKRRWDREHKVRVSKYTAITSYRCNSSLARNNALPPIQCHLLHPRSSVD